MRTRNSCSKIRERTTYTVRTRPGQRTQGLLRAGTLVVPCALGRSGINANKKEGDGATPLGIWRVVEVRYRPDRLQRPRTRLPLWPTRPKDGWCDASSDRNYNCAVTLPYPQSAETMWREDHLYDLVVILDHNARPRARGRGSAVFVHLAWPGYTPTEGCVALSLPHLRLLLARWRPGDQIQIAFS